MWLIILLLIIGIFLLIVELVLTPGVSIALFGAVASFGISIYLGFTDYGMLWGVIVSVIVGLISVTTVVIALREDTWKRFSLNSEIKSSSQERAEDTNVKLGQLGIAVTRLAPMGKILVDGQTYEAKSPTIYIDERSEVEVIGFENFSLIVKKTDSIDKLK